MPAFSLIFNKLQVEVPSKNLSLSVESSVSLQTPSKSIQHVSTKHLLDLLCFGNVWVTHGNGCPIDIAILLDSQLDDEPGMEIIIDNVAASIRETLLLSQVSLNADLENLERGVSNNLRSSFSILLRRAPSKDILARSNIALSSLPPDVQVPTCIKCFQLRRIKIVMTFKSGKPYQTARPTPPHMDSFGRRALDLYPHALLCQDLEMLDDDTLLHGMDIAIPLLMTHKLTRNLSVLPSPPDSQEERMSKTQSDCVMSSIVSDLSCTREMTYLALSKLIGGRQKKNQTGIKVVLRRPTLTLARLAPSLFCPGFAEAMSQRSQFIPKISHTLSVSLMRNAQSPSLRRKLLSLASNPASQLVASAAVDPVNGMHGQSGHAENQTSRTLGSVVEERLWVMMQRSLNNPLSARHASVPTSVNNSMDGVEEVGLDKIPIDGSKEAENITEESSTSRDQDLGFLEDDFEDDFEDLFGNLQDAGENEELETFNSERKNGKSSDNDSGDMFDGEILMESDEAAYATLEQYNDDFEIITDHNVRYWEYTQIINNGDPLHEYITQRHNMLDIENNEMLI